MTLFEKLKEVLSIADYEEELFEEDKTEDKTENKVENEVEDKTEDKVEEKTEDKTEEKTEDLAETNQLVKELIETIKKQGQQKKYVNEVVSDKKNIEIKTPDDLVKAYLNNQIKI